MKKLILFLATMFIVSCASLSEGSKMSQSYLLSEGMTMPEVQEIMGVPCASELSKGVTEWHYCSTGFNADEYVAVFFENGLLIAIKNYTVTLVDVGGIGGHCSKFIKRGTYQEPDVVVAIRSRYGD